jgi:hypothetical protein
MAVKNRAPLPQFFVAEVPVAEAAATGNMVIPKQGVPCGQRLHYSCRESRKMDEENGGKIAGGEWRHAD